MTGASPSNILAQMGLGGAKDIVNLPYNPSFKIYYQKVSLMTASSLITYVKSDKITEEFMLKKDDPIFKDFLNQNELDLAFRGKEKFLFPQITDCSTFDADDNSKLSVKIDDLFHSLESFLAVTEPNILFIMDAKKPDDPDLILAFNIMPEMPSAENKNSLKIDVYLDYDHKTKDIIYIQRKEDYSINYLKEIKDDLSHAELFKSSFSLVLHIKSIEKPY